MVGMHDFFFAYFSMLKCVVGGCLLQYTYLFSTYGAPPTVLGSLFSALISLFGLFMYIDLGDSARHVSSGAESVLGGAAPARVCDVTISTLPNYTFVPWMKHIVNFVICVKSFAVTTVYIGLLNELLRFLIAHTFHTRHRASFLAVVLVVLFPINIPAGLRSVQLFSITGVAVTFFLVASVMVRSFVLKGGRRPDSNPQSWRRCVPSTGTLLSDIGTLIFSYSCHQNIFGIDVSMSSGALKADLAIVMTTAIAIYCAFGFAGLRLYGPDVRSTLLKYFTHDRSSFSFYVALMYFVGISFTFPLHTNPCIAYGMRMLGDGYSDPNEHNVLRVAFAMAIMFGGFAIVVWMSDINKLFNLTGGIFTSSINLLFPSIFFFLNKHMAWDLTNVAMGASLCIMGLLCLTVSFKPIVSNILKRTR